MGLFLHVLGTDTGVGKTVATIGLTRALGAAGRTVSVAKPFATGAGADGTPEDTATLLRAFPEVTADDLSPWTAVEPLAPAVAAERSGVNVPLADVTARMRTRVAELDLLVVEGIGGVRTPLAAGTAYLEWAAELGGVAVVVTRPTLGTLNHTALTVEACERAGLPVIGVIPCHAEPAAREDIASATNTAALAASLSVPVWPAIAHHPGAPADLPAQALAEQATAVLERLWGTTRTLPVHHISHARVRYGETDQMGMAYHGEYFAWFDLGRTELLRAQGLPYSELERRDILLTVTEANCRYVAPARYDEDLRVHTALTSVKGVRVHFTYRVLRVHDGALLAEGATTLACVNRAGRPRRLPEELTRLLPARGDDAP